jgi:hypothetical protein
MGGQNRPSFVRKSELYGMKYVGDVLDAFGHAHSSDVHWSIDGGVYLAKNDGVVTGSSAN